MTAPRPPEPAGEPGTIPAVEDALARLATVADAPPADQVAPLAEADRVLRETLDSIDDL